VSQWREFYRFIPQNWDRIWPQNQCPHCHGTGLAPGDGRTECGFCHKDGKDAG
jgi:ribosomal protein S27AE